MNTSVSTTADLIAKFRATPALNERLNATAGQSFAAFSAVVITIAAEHHVTLTQADLDAWLQANTPPAALAPNGELSEADLENVSGGAWPPAHKNCCFPDL